MTNDIFNPKQKETLKLVCDTLIPAISGKNEFQSYWETQASDFEVNILIEETVSKLHPEEIKDFRQLLDILANPLVGLSWGGSLKGFKKLSPEQREKLLKRWSSHPIELLRKGFLAVKKLCSFIYFGYSEPEKPNPSWTALKYPGPAGDIKPFDQYPTEVKVDASKTFDCDILIIGTGAGGGVVAGELSKSGKKIVILEKGPFVKHHEMTQREAPMIAALYEHQGALTSVDGVFSIFAGSNVGGGTTINWEGSFRTPDYVLQEWASEHNNPQFIDKEYTKCFEAIEQRLNVNTDYTAHGEEAAMLLKGARALNLHGAKIPKNIKGWEGIAPKEFYYKSGFSTIGDAYNFKQCMTSTYIQDATDRGAILMANTEAAKLSIQNGVVTGAIAFQTDEAGNKHKITIKAEKVVVSAGSIHTPALLKRSGLSHPEIGNHLYLHPVIVVPALYENPIRAWEGPVMSSVSDSFARMDGNFGVKLETPPVHSGLMGLALPWRGGETFKEEMLQVENLGMIIVLTRDKFGGKIKLNKQGKPTVHYKINPYDYKHMVKGAQEAARIHHAAGAKEIRMIHHKPVDFDASKDHIDEFVKRFEQIKWGGNRSILFSAHQMGTCRMGGDNKRHPIKPNGETREVRNLFVADASAFPQCSGANPMLSIQALAYYTAQHI